jgi:RNA polymerase I-specific transcription initiation factor RRN3
MLLPHNRRRIRPPRPPSPPPLYVSLLPSLPPIQAQLTNTEYHSYPQIEKNKSVHLSQFFTGSYATGGALRDSGFEFDDEKWTHLEACFPFDPFQLPVAKRWLDLKNSYVAWQPMAVLGLDGEDDEDDEGLDEEDGESEGESEFEDAVGVAVGVVVVDKVVGSLVEDTATDEEGGIDE